MFLWECHVLLEREVAFCAVNLATPFFSIIVEYIPMIFIMFFFFDQVAKKHLTQRIQNLNDKVEKQNEISKDIRKNVSKYVPFGLF